MTPSSAAAPVLLEPREVPLGGTRAMSVRRTLPHRSIRTIGAWCFVDHYGPQAVAADGTGGMLVPAHPHTGLQTVTWLLAGEVVHDDSVGSHQLIRPGELNLMTAGSGIAHSEVSRAGFEGLLEGVQLWVALPDGFRDQAPSFEHHAALPRIVDGPVTTTVLLGEVQGARSPATTYSPLLGAVVEISEPGTATLPLDRAFEHGLLALDHAATVEGVLVERGTLAGFGPGRTALHVTVEQPAQLLLLGGAPFEEDLVMWWNFVGRSYDEIVDARTDWETGRRFGPVAGDAGSRMPAPRLPTSRLVPRRSGGLPAEGTVPVTSQRD